MSNPVKSKFRGVYKCGKRWKAQLQCQGIQFYLGTFDTEIEAAKAYDRKARDEKGVKGLTNFDENGDEATSGSGPFHSGLYDGAAVSSTSSQAESSESLSFTNKPKISSSSTSAPVNNLYASSDNVVPGMLVTINNNSVQVRMMWERLCQITQRILLCKAAHEKLYELQKSSPDRNKEGLLSNLGDEISLLTQVKQQVEEAIARSVSQSLTATLATTVAADVFAPTRSADADVVVASSSPHPHPPAIIGNGGGNNFVGKSHSILNEAHTDISEEEVDDDDDEGSLGDQSPILTQTGTVDGEEDEGREYIDEEEGVMNSTANYSSGNKVVDGTAAVPSPIAMPPSPYPP